jgi:hypothetical protein
MKHEFPEIPNRKIQENILGIGATVTFHPVHVEKISGGDFGVVIARPDVIYRDNNTIRLKSKYVGLLAQAKLKKTHGVFKGRGTCRFTNKQRELYNERSDYLAIVFYKYTDEQLKSLEPFSWQICADLNLKETGKILRSGNPRTGMTSDEIIHSLGGGKIGTSDSLTIEQLIIPAVDYHLVIRIGWPDDGDDVRLIDLACLRESNRERQVIKLGYS